MTSFTPCSACERQIRDGAARCPYCGHEPLTAPREVSPGPRIGGVITVDGDDKSWTVSQDGSPIAAIGGYHRLREGRSNGRWRDVAMGHESDQWTAKLADGRLWGLNTDILAVRQEPLQPSDHTTISAHVVDEHGQEKASIREPWQAIWIPSVGSVTIADVATRTGKARKAYSGEWSIAIPHPVELIILAEWQYREFQAASVKGVARAAGRLAWKIATYRPGASGESPYERPDRPPPTRRV